MTVQLTQGDCNEMLTLGVDGVRIAVILGGIFRGSFYFDAQHVYNAIIVKEQCPVTESLGDPAKDPKASKLPGTVLF